MPHIVHSAAILLILMTTTVLTDSIVKTDSMKVVVQSDHFDSKEEKTSTYVLSNVQEDKPLVMILRKDEDHSFDFNNNHVTISLQSEKEIKKCIF